MGLLLWKAECSPRHERPVLVENLRLSGRLANLQSSPVEVQMQTGRPHRRQRWQLVVATAPVG